jgi:hypothetical protein
MISINNSGEYPSPMLRLLIVEFGVAVDADRVFMGLSILELSGGQSINNQPALYQDRKKDEGALQGPKLQACVGC